VVVIALGFERRFLRESYAEDGICLAFWGFGRFIDVNNGLVLEVQFGGVQRVQELVGFKRQNF